MNASVEPSRPARPIAQFGGPKIRTEPLNPWPFMDKGMIEAVTTVLESGKINSTVGDRVHTFENRWADYCGRQHAIAVTNGTAALELGLRALGIGPGDEVIVPSRTFMATASAVVMVGATPRVADVDRNSQNLTVETIAAQRNARTRAIIPVHLAGWPCDMPDIMAYADAHNLLVLEDCAQAHGATLDGRVAGGFGHAAAFSFCQDKIITTAGEGGMLVVDDETVHARAWSFKDHGKDLARMQANHPPGFRWLIDSFGTNLRMTEVQGAVGCVAVDRLGRWLEIRRRHANRLMMCVSAHRGLRCPIPRPGIEHAYYKFYCFVEPSELASGWDRDAIMAAIAAEGIPCYSGSCSEIYLERAFSESLRPAQRFPVARELGETSLMFLVHPTLDEREIEDTCRAIDAVMAVATR